MIAARTWIALVALVVAAAPEQALAADNDAALLGRWRLTTLVDKEAERLSGVNGFYELIVSQLGERLLVAIAKVGHSGKDYLPGEVMTGAAEPRLERDERGGVRGVQLEVGLRSRSGATQSMVFELARDGDALLGFWALREPGGPESTEEAARDYAVFGAARAEAGSGPRVRLGPKTPLPCRLVCDIRYRCGGAGPGACNSSNVCHDACDNEGGRAAPP